MTTSPEATNIPRGMTVAAEEAVAQIGTTNLTMVQVLSGLHTVRSVLAPDLTDEELRLFAMVATRSGLDPFARQVYAVKRQGRVTFQTGIDGYRSIAARTGLYDGQDEPEYGPACGCGDKRSVGHPEFATVRAYRKGVGRPIAATAFWHEYRPEPGPSGRGDAMWQKMPRVMLAKVAEALALRKAFPYDPENRIGIGADVYTGDEMAQADQSSRVTVVSTATARERLAARRAELEATSVAADSRSGETPVAGPSDEHQPAPALTRAAFLKLVAAAGIGRDAIATAATELFPRVESRHYTEVQWGAVANRLGLPRATPGEPSDA
jgi:phage recombination protein Bet